VCLPIRTYEWSRAQASTENQMGMVRGNTMAYGVGAAARRQESDICVEEKDSLS